MEKLQRLKRYSSLVALPHSVFALPFALSSLLLANRANSFSPHFSQIVPPQLSVLTWFVVILAVVFARTSAMAFNRLVDATIDAKNPRTHHRELPKGLISKLETKLLAFLSGIAFIICSAILGRHCATLAPFVLIILLGYSYTKRFTSYSHLVLGLALSLAPAGAWWVLRPIVESVPLALSMAVLFWVAGFDTLYSCQDFEFDRKTKLHSIPARFGIRNALIFAKVFHLISALFFVLVGMLTHLSVNYFFSLGFLAVLFLGQHLLLSEEDLSRINMSFFTFNGMISIGYFMIIYFAV